MNPLGPTWFRPCPKIWNEYLTFKHLVLSIALWPEFLRTKFSDMAANYVLWWSWWFTVAFSCRSSMQKPVVSNSQTNLLGEGCSQYNATNIPNFFKRLNASFDDLRNQLSKHDKRFATTKQSVYAMVTCRKYMSKADCLSCFDAAVIHIRTCGGANGAHFIYDGCFLRWVSSLNLSSTAWNSLDQLYKYLT